MAAAHRVHVWPRLRRVGGLILRNWVAIAIGRHIFAWRPLSADELAHELTHVRQWGAYGVTFPVRYLWASLSARLAGKRWYADNRFEVEAKAAEPD